MLPLIAVRHVAGVCRSAGTVSLSRQGCPAQTRAIAATNLCCLASGLMTIRRVLRHPPLEGLHVQRRSCVSRPHRPAGPCIRKNWPEPRSPAVAKNQGKFFDDVARRQRGKRAVALRRPWQLVLRERKSSSRTRSKVSLRQSLRKADRG